MNENEINLGEFRTALNKGEYNAARKMLDGKYSDLFIAYNDVSEEMRQLGVEVRNPEELKKLSSGKEGLEAIACLLELTTNNGLMLTQLNVQEEIK